MQRKPEDQSKIPRPNEYISPGASAMLESLRSGGRQIEPSPQVSQILSEVSRRSDAIDYQPRPPGTPTLETVDNRRREAQEKAFYDTIKGISMQSAPEQTPVETTVPTGGAATGKMITQPMQIGHFNTQEFASGGGGEIKVAYDLITRLNQLRDYLGVPIRITSGYRSPAHNATIKGASPNSRHISGEAADISAQGISTQKLAEAAKKFFGDGGIGVYQGHVHVDIGPQRRW